MQIDSNKNEKQATEYQNFNHSGQKFLTNDGVCLFFSNVFEFAQKDKLPTIKHKLKRILVDYGLSKTYIELNPKLDYIMVFYRDAQAKELKGCLLQHYNYQNPTSERIELVISLDDDLVSEPKQAGQEVYSYSGLTKLLFQEFIQLHDEPVSLADTSIIDFEHRLKETIKHGNESPPEPLQAIFREQVE